MVQEDFITDARNSRKQPIKKYIVDDAGTNFVGPKSLVELKVVKNAKNNEQKTKVQQLLSLERQRNLKIEDHQQFEGDLLFEGPKSLSVVLKRKNEAEIAISRSDNGCMPRAFCYLSTPSPT